MQTALRVAGPDICFLRVIETQVHHLHRFTRLRELHISYLGALGDSCSPNDLSFLGGLPELQALHLGIDLNLCKPLLFTGLAALQQLRVLHVVNGLAVDLPASVVELRCTVSEQVNIMALGQGHVWSRQLRLFRWWLPSFRGSLSVAELDMQHYHQNPVAMCGARGIPCLRGAASVRLNFSAWTHDPPSFIWSPEVFQQLHTLHLHFGQGNQFFQPTWCLASCAVEELVLSIRTQHPERLCLSKVSGVTAARLQLHFLCRMGNSSPNLICTSWAVSQVSISCSQLGKVGLPACVMDSLGALMGSGAVAYNCITVNGLAPAAAISAAAAKAAVAQSG